MAKTNDKNLSRRSRANGQGSIYYIESRKCYGASIKDYLGKRVTKNFKTKDEAHAWILEQKNMRSQGIACINESPKLTVSEYLLDWIEHNKNSKKPSTTRNYSERVRNQINPKIGHLRVHALSPKVIEKLISDLVSAEYAPGTILGVFRTLSAAFTDGVRLRALAHNPTENVKLPNFEINPIRQIPKCDAIKIYNEATKDPYMHARIEIGMVSGLRPGEVLGLLWADVDWVERQLTIVRQVQRVKGKGLVFQSVKQGKSRPIVLTDVQIDILRAHKSNQDLIRGNWDVDENLIFPNSLGKKLDDKKDSLMWKQLLQRAGVPHYQRYQMRKTAFSTLSAELGDMRQLMDYSGHSQISTVMRSYVFATEDALDKTRRAIDASRPQLREMH
jgi:integrase